MSVPQTLPAVSATAGTPTPVYTGAVTAASSFVIKGGLATITLNASTLPFGYETGKAITLWGFTTATYFNGLTVNVVSNNTSNKSFSFKTTHADVSSTSDAGNTAISPTERFRGVRLEADKGNGTNAIYVGDGSVSASRYTTQLMYNSWSMYIWYGGDDVAAQDLDVSRIWVDTDSTGTKVQVSLVH